MQITQDNIYNCFPWAKPFDLGIEDSDEGFFYDAMPWTFN